MYLQYETGLFGRLQLMMQFAKQKMQKELEVRLHPISHPN